MISPSATPLKNNIMEISEFIITKAELNKLKGN
jgi:hypothetical protein